MAASSLMAAAVPAGGGDLGVAGVLAAGGGGLPPWTLMVEAVLAGGGGLPAGAAKGTRMEAAVLAGGGGLGVKLPASHIAWLVIDDEHACVWKAWGKHVGSMCHSACVMEEARAV